MFRRRFRAKYHFIEYPSQGIAVLINDIGEVYGVLLKVGVLRRSISLPVQTRGITRGREERR